MSNAYSPRFSTPPAQYSQEDETQFRNEVVRALMDVDLSVKVEAEAGNLFPTSILGWSHDLTFNASDYRTVAWGSGTISLQDGTQYAIGASNTGAMASTVYIFLDLGVSDTTLQTTATASDAVGNNRILVAVAAPVADTAKDAEFMVYGGSGDVGASKLFTAAQIAADTLTANEIAANTITGTEVQSMVITGKTLTADTGTVGGWSLAAGAFSSGNVTLNASNEQLLFGSATAPLTGVGIFLGLDGADYEFRAGDPAGEYIHWDGTNLFMTGTITASSALIANDTYLRWRDSGGTARDIMRLAADGDFEIQNPVGDILINAVTRLSSTFVMGAGTEIRVESAATYLTFRSLDASGFWDLFTTGGVGTEDETIRVFGSSGRTLNVNLLDGDLTLTAGQLFLHDGTAGNPGLTFGGDADLGLFRAGSNTLAVSTGGAQRAQFLSTGLRVVDGSATNPSYSFLSDGDTGVYRVGSNALGLASGGTLRLEIQAVGTIVRSGQILNLAGSVSAPTYAFNGDPNTGLYRVAADRLGLAAGGLLIAELRDTAPLLHLQGVSGELLRLDDSSATGNPYLSFYQSGTSRARLRWVDSNDSLYIETTSSAHTLRFAPGGSTAVSLTAAVLNIVDGTYLSIDTSADQATLLEFDTPRAWQFEQENTGASTGLALRTTSSGKRFRIWDPTRATGIYFLPDSTPVVEVVQNTNELLRLKHSSATGSPYISLYQSSLRRAYIQFRDTDDSLRIFNDVNDDSWDFKSNGDFVANDGDVIATV